MLLLRRKPKHMHICNTSHYYLSLWIWNIFERYCITSWTCLPLNVVYYMRKIWLQYKIAVINVTLAMKIERSSTNTITMAANNIRYIISLSRPLNYQIPPHRFHSNRFFFVDQFRRLLKMTNAVATINVTPLHL